MRSLLVQAARVNFTVCTAVMDRAGAATQMEEKYTSFLPLSWFLFTPFRCTFAGSLLSY